MIQCLAQHVGQAVALVVCCGWVVGGWKPVGGEWWVADSYSGGLLYDGRWVEAGRW